MIKSHRLLSFPTSVAALGLLTAVYLIMLPTPAPPGAQLSGPADPAATGESKPGPGSVTLEPGTGQLIALETVRLTESSYKSRYVAYGRLVEDPAEVFVVRAPVAGVLREADGRAWPSIGRQLRQGELLFMVEPLLVPVERLGLESQLAAARAELSSATALLTAAKAAFERARTLHAENQNVSLSTLQEAEARLKGEEARTSAATETVRMTEAALAAKSGPAAPLPITVPKAGEAVEILGQPGETVEAGQAVLRGERFERLLARVYLPAGEWIEAPIASARIVPVGLDGRSFPAEMVSYGAEVDPETQGQPFLLRLSTQGIPLRPGTAVSAQLIPRTKAETGMEIPRSAVVWYQGKTWAYVQASRDRFQRRPVSLASPLEEGWFAVSGFAAGERVVVSGAQMLLSIELKSRIPAGS